VQFFDLVINGQEQLRLLYKNEKDFEKDQIEYETIVDDSQQYWIANNEIDLRNLEAANENIINNDLRKFKKNIVKVFINITFFFKY